VGEVDIGNTVDVEVTNEIEIAPGQEIRILGKGRRIADATWDDGYGTNLFMDVSGMKTIYIYLERTGEVDLQYDWVVNDGVGNYWYLPFATSVSPITGSGFKVITLSQVRANGIHFHVVSKADDNEITCWVYASPN
jgi:hypothetical protein